MRRRSGWSLVESLAALVLLAAAATFGLGLYLHARDDARRAAVQEALGALVPAQERFRSDSGRYATDLAQLTTRREVPHVFIVVERADRDEYRAHALYEATSITCSVTSIAGTATAVTCP